jgi:hypothetical protein
MTLQASGVIDLFTKNIPGAQRKESSLIPGWIKKGFVMLMLTGLD